MSEYIYATNGKVMGDEDGLISIPREEIVRCRDCKHYHEYQDLCERLKPGMVVDPDGFCAWGERKSEWA